MSVSRSRPSLISLFTGAGGLDIGLEQAGFETVLASEIEPYACATLRANKLLRSLNSAEFERWFEEQTQQLCYRKITEPERNRLRHRLLQPVRHHEAYLEKARIVEGDIRQLTAPQVVSVTGLRRGKLDLIAGGPPCQPFSRAGKRETVEVAEGRLFLEFVRLVDQLRPRWFLFENVKGLAQTRTDSHFAYCLRCGRETFVPFSHRDRPAGFVSKLRCNRCDAGGLKLITRSVRGGSLSIIESEFQRIGYTCNSRVLNAAEFGAPQSRERLFIVGSRDGENFEWPRSTHETCLKPNVRDAQFSLFDASELQPCRTMSETLWPKGHWRYGKLDPQKAVLWVKNVVRPHDEPVTWTLDRIAPTVGAHQAAKLAIAPDGVPKEQLERQQWHVLGRRQGDRPPVFVEHEYLSDEDLLTLQTFPHSWYFAGTRMERAFQIGNAVPPVLGNAMGRALLKSMGALRNEGGGKPFTPSVQARKH